MTENKRQKQRLRAYFAFTKVPFHKAMRATEMYDSAAQRELRYALEMWTELHGIGVIVGPSGVGKSITLRRYVGELDKSRFNVIRFTYMPTTTAGFLRSLTRTLELPMRAHAADLFDALQQHLVNYEQENGPHPMIIVDDAEGLSVAVLDVLRRLTSWDLDAQEHFSILISGTETLLRTLRHESLTPLRSRVAYTHNLRPFSLEDTRNYVKFHLERAEGDAKLFSDEAIKNLFQVSGGKPRLINQLAIQTLIQAAVMGREKISGKFMTEQINNHPFYHHLLGA